MRAWVVLVLLLPLLCSHGEPARAQEAPGASAEPVPVVPRRGARMRPAVFERLAAAQRAAEIGRHAEALGLLEALERDFGGGRSLNAYERANLHYFRGFIHEARGEGAGAIAAYGRVLGERGLPATMASNTRYALARLHLAAEDWAQAAALLEAWFRDAEKPPPDAHAKLARALYGLGKHERALAEIDTALAVARRLRLPPQEGWYLLMRAAAFDSGDTARTRLALETLARDWPRKEYFLQLGAVYGQAGETARRVAAIEAAWLAGWLVSEQELLSLAYLYLEAGLPRRAAALIEREHGAGRIARNAANLGLLAAAWQQAGEAGRSLAPLREATGPGADAAQWLRLATLELQLGEAGAAARSARAALSAGGGERPDAARILLGTALFEAGRIDEAREAFLAAGRDPRSQEEAGRWVRYLDTESERRAMAM